MAGDSRSESPTMPDGSAKLIYVEILGHIFEQSINDLEQLHRPSPRGRRPRKRSRRRRSGKREGAFYTPPFITRYIVDATLRPALAERFAAYRRRRSEQAKGQSAGAGQPRRL